MAENNKEYIASSMLAFILSLASNSEGDFVVMAAIDLLTHISGLRFQRDIWLDSMYLQKILISIFVPKNLLLI